MPCALGVTGGDPQHACCPLRLDSPSLHSPCFNLPKGNKLSGENESVSPLPTLNQGTDTVRSGTSCIYHTSPMCPAHGYVMWVRPAQLNAHMERRSRPLPVLLSTLCRRAGCPRTLDSHAGCLCIHPPCHLPPSLQDRPTDTPHCRTVDPGLDTCCLGQLFHAAAHNPSLVL